MQTVDLIPIPIQIQQMFDDMSFIQSNLTLEEIRDTSLRHMTLRLKSYVLAEESGSSYKDVTVSYEVPILPPIFYEAFPEVKNYPKETRYETVKIKLAKRLLYPNAPAIPNFGGNRVRFMVEEERPNHV